MPLKLNGKPLTLEPDFPVVGKIRGLIGKLPKDELLTTREVCVRAKTSESRIREHKDAGRFSDICAKMAGKVYWGKPEALAALRKMVQQ